MFNLLIKPKLSKSEREQIKKMAKDLLETLKAEKCKSKTGLRRRLPVAQFG
jgi:uncharacterized protein (DUF305 family)